MKLDDGAVLLLSNDDCRGSFFEDERSESGVEGGANSDATE